ncbi:MAG: GNAT family N-acetyltransferase [Deltaproteobacteria bacterium]|nr:GNAT family N-acetyltransferase [Deltaproteobacteria bacterium]MBN2846649.1 GNAT family N-acetyltransferase [Deltaproteobacteria bacterium]
MSITIRKMIPEDMSHAVSILSQWNIAPIIPSRENPDPERSSINIGNSFVALDRDRVIGVCSYIIHSEELAETASLAVDSDYKNKGIGYKLQKARLDEMKKRGIKRVRTETDRPENVEWFTKKFHYRIIGKNKKKHPFGLPDIDYWNVLELDLERYEG